MKWLTLSSGVVSEQEGEKDIFSNFEVRSLTDFCCSFSVFALLFCAGFVRLWVKWLSVQI